MTTIQFKSAMKIIGITPRLQGSKSEDSQVRALDLKMHGHVKGDFLAALLYSDAESVADFWTESTDGILPAYRNLGACKSTTTFDNCNFSLDKLKFQAAQARAFNFKVEPDHSLEITFTVRLFDLSDATVGALLKQYQEVVAIDIESAQIDFIEESP